MMNEKESLKSNEEALQLFEKTVQFKEERYEVRLPWKNEDHDLPSNYNVAKRRFDQLVKKFQSNVPLYEKYSDVIKEYVSQGIVERVQNVVTDNPTYYLPHRAVINEERLTTKLRVVFDAMPMLKVVNH